ncbi:MAG TPA: FmdB family zinc ribbon protein [Acidimicrobiia bacterium]|nr:FmdB family zinc ribbon protein [Acidimicrobiia bacterium]
MPTYEYTCKTCGETLEVFQSFSEKPLRKHAECGGELKKVFHARGVVFKGSGFYSTDSRSSSAASSKKSEPSKKGESSKSEKTTKSEASAPAASSTSSSD